MRCLKPILIHGTSFNCGKCRACRVNYTSMWKLRLLYELDNFSDSMFVTLTFNEETLAKHGNTLNKKDVQNFIKRVRRYMAYNRDERKIKYYFVGEYGSNTKRAHYHGIIFGLSPYDDKDRSYISDAWPFCDSWQFDKSRGKKSAIGSVTPDSIAYVTGYVQKKLSGPLAEKEYGDKVRPFSLCSQGLGLGLAKKQADMLSKGYTYMNGKRVGVPRYFRDKLGIALNYEKPISSRIRNDFDEINSLFISKYGKPSMGDLDSYTRRFERFIENKEYEIADRVYKDFLQREKLKGGKI